MLNRGMNTAGGGKRNIRSALLCNLVNARGPQTARETAIGLRRPMGEVFDGLRTLAKEGVVLLVEGGAFGRWKTGWILAARLSAAEQRRYKAEAEAETDG